MKTITFHAYICGMSENAFTDKIMIYEPIAKFEKIFCYDELPIKTISEFIDLVKNDASVFLGESGTEQLNVERLYIQTADALIGMQNDKLLDDVFAYFSTDNIQLAYFLVGGASIRCMGYKFVVHPNEDIHRNKPHVHVCKDEDSVRYSLITLERFKQDSLPRTYNRDEKKVIIPFLRENQDTLMAYWNHYINGYTVPDLDEHGQQYYPES